MNPPFSDWKNIFEDFENQQKFSAAAKRMKMEMTRKNTNAGSQADTRKGGTSFKARAEIELITLSLDKPEPGQA